MNVCFAENFAYVQNERSLTEINRKNIFLTLALFKEAALTHLMPLSSFCTPLRVA